MALPPLLAGVSHSSTAWPLEADARRLVGAAAEPNGTPVTDALVAPGPAAVSAVTWNPYVTPAVKPETTKFGVDEYEFAVAVAQLPVLFTRYSTRYPRIGYPPRVAGGVHETYTLFKRPDASIAVGASTDAIGVSKTTDELAIPVEPRASTGVTRNAYVLSVISPVIV